MTRGLLGLAGLMALLLSLGGCHILLLSPCLSGGCGVTISPLPPLDTVIARALQSVGDPDRVEEPLTGVALAQWTALGRQWPATMQCDRIAAPGCRYSIPLRVDWHEGLKTDFRGCARIDLIVAEAKDGSPEVRRTGYAPMTCPAGWTPEPPGDGLLPVK